MPKSNMSRSFARLVASDAVARQVALHGDAFVSNGRALDPTRVNREAMITQALETDEGRQALAAAMMEPIRRQLDYEGIGRRILMVDELPLGALERYERDVRAVAAAITRPEPGAIPPEVLAENAASVRARQHFYSPEPAFGDGSRWDEI